jgi:hypothetical protein
VRSISRACELDVNAAPEYGIVSHRKDADRLRSSSEELAATWSEICAETDGVRKYVLRRLP